MTIICLEYKSELRYCQVKNIVIINFMISDRIKKLMKDRQINQKQLSIGAGIPQPSLSEILKNKYEPGVHTVRRIAEYLNVDLNWLITGKYLEERRFEFKQDIEVLGKDISMGNIQIIKEGNIIYERRSDYKLDKMSEIIEKGRELSPSSRDAVIKIMDVYLDIDKKQKHGDK